MTEIVRGYLSTVKVYLSLRDIRNSFALLTPYMLKYWKLYLVLIVLLFADIAMTLAFSWFFGSLTDAAIQSQFARMQLLIPVGILLLLVSLTSTYLNTVYETKVTLGVKRDFSLQFYKHILLLPQKDISQRHSGELMAHFSNDIHSIDGVIGRSLINLIRLPLIYTAVFVYLLQIHWKLALLCVAFAPIALGFGIVFGVLLRNNGRMVYRLIGQMSTHLNETFHGISIIHSFIMEKIMFSSYARKNQEIYNLELRNAQLRGWFFAGGQAASTITFLLSLSMGSYYVSIGLLTVGSLLTFVNLVHHLVYPLTELAGQWAGFQRSAAAVERINGILHLPLETKKLPIAMPSRRLLTSIRFQDVTFSYDGKTNVFEHLNMQIPAGKVVAIVGLSGAGKTTLFQLLQAFYKPQKGHIFIDGRSSEQLLPSELRSLFAHVSQDTFLFDRTIRENLLLAREGITEIDMIQATTIANIHAYIESLPSGYDTEIGERGIRLSGGQKQRLAIARAVLKNAPILLLDEATSALDNETEEQVQEALNRLMVGRTTLIIAHRLSTIQHADVIYVLDQGSIVQIGQHDDLMRENGKYRSLNNHAFQKGGELVDHFFNSSAV